MTEKRDPSDGFYLIWSEEHGAWWRPARRGYTTSIKDAGRYLLSAAEEIVRSANFGGTFHEIAIPCPAGIPS